MSWEAKSFQVEIPEIYQLELTNACNLKCSMCIREDERVKRPIGFMDIELVKRMVDRGDFEGSYFVELQMYGEVLLNPELGEFIELLHTVGIKVGLSTNGTMVKERLNELCTLDYLTISVDTTDKKEYEEQRGYKFDDLVNNINLIYNCNKRPKIDLQVINFWDGKDNLPGLIETFKGYDVTCRSVPDCFAAYQDRNYPSEQRYNLCLNPWLSVSVHWDGDVVPCCFSAGKHIVYGNLYRDSLKDIWNNSNERLKLTDDMRRNYNIDREPCLYCYMRSPVLFHQRMLMQNIRGG